MRLRTNEDCDQLFLYDREVFAEDGETFDLVASEAGDIVLSEIPVGIKVQLCDRVIGSPNELVPRSPQVVFANTQEMGLVAYLSTPFLPPMGGASGDELKQYFSTAVAAAVAALKPMENSGRILSIERSIYDDIAFLSYVIRMYDQTLCEAECFVTEIEFRTTGAYCPPNLFLCHASEDKPFVDRLAAALDRRALFAWYDKREIFVGDSIVEKVNTGLRSSDFLVAILSPRSVVKPWVVREMSSSLMRQLRDTSILILPVLLEACDIPPLFVDLKYADFSASFETGMSDLVAAISRGASSDPLP